MKMKSFSFYANQINKLYEALNNLFLGRYIVFPPFFKFMKWVNYILYLIKFKYIGTHLKLILLA